MTQHRAPETCANCGAAIPPKARACPECGADERTGWAEQSLYDGLDLPEDDDERAQAETTRQHRQTRRWLWWAVGVFLILVLALAALGVRLR
jgi:predicted nucleic acid-binding Zn ribbon protein